MKTVRNWLNSHKETIQSNNLQNVYIRTAMPIPEVCFVLNKPLDSNIASFWRPILHQVREIGVEASVHDGTHGEFSGERWGWEKIQFIV